MGGSSGKPRPDRGRKVRTFSTELAAVRLRLTPRFIAAALVAAAGFSTLVALLERAETPSTAPDYTLQNAVLGWAVPLLAYAVVSRSCKDGRADAALTVMVRHGGSRREALLGLVAGGAASAAASSAAVSVLAVLVARARFDLPAAGDLLTSGWIGAVGGAVYATLFILGSLFGKKGQGRAAALVADWILGTIPGVTGAFFPRAHLSSLAGGAPILGMPGWQSFACLYAMVAAFVLLSTAKVPA